MADPRNDQTLIILQLHVAMQKFHNRLVEVLRMQGVPRSAVFESARRLARWHYQWIVTHQFLPAIVGHDHDGLDLPGNQKKGAKVTLKYYKPETPRAGSFIPVEFAVAAYRFGHSITRPRYTVRTLLLSRHHSSGLCIRRAVVPGRTQREQLERPPRSAACASAEASVEQVLQRDGGKYTARPTRQFDASLADPLFKMPTTALPDANALGLLSQRNLRRGRKMNLPSGQQVAKLMAVTPLTNAQTFVERPHPRPHPHRRQQGGWSRRLPLASTTRKNQKAPQDRTCGSGVEGRGSAVVLHPQGGRARRRPQGRTLGPVGGRIVAEVLVGLLQKDPNSYLYLQPNLEARASHRADERPVHHGRSPEIRWGLVPTREVMNLYNRSRLTTLKIRRERGDETCKKRSRKIGPAGTMAARVAAAGMALAAAVTLAGCHEARGGGYIGQVVPRKRLTPSSTCVAVQQYV